MRIEPDLSCILELIACAISYLCGKIDLESEKFFNIILKSLRAFSVGFLVLSCLKLGSLGLADYFIMAVLSFAQRNLFILAGMYRRSGGTGSSAIIRFC